MTRHDEGPGFLYGDTRMRNPVLLIELRSRSTDRHAVAEPPPPRARAEADTADS